MNRIAPRQTLTSPDSVTHSDWLIAIVIGCALSLGIWHELLTGGGIVGGDTYPYFFPQKQVMADGFAHGELPLWHDRTGLGYPLHAESQAGIFYPTNQLFYRLFAVNTAYNVSILMHYAIAFVFAWRFCRSQLLSQPSHCSRQWCLCSGGSRRDFYWNGASSVVSGFPVVCGCRNDSSVDPLDRPDVSWQSHLEHTCWPGTSRWHSSRSSVAWATRCWHQGERRRLQRLSNR